MRLPTPFGKYLLLERISVGGMAEVFKAKAFGVEGFEKIIAIKKILPSMAEDADFIQMFIDEAKICGQLNHANICQNFELGRIDDSHFIAMEYIWGKDLLQIQNRLRKLKQPKPIKRVLIAWNGSREAARATFDALPFLQAAETVEIFTVDASDTANQTGAMAGAEIAASLARHGINVTLTASEKSGLAPAMAIENRLSDSSIDLLVMGAYGNKRWWEMLFGGVTRTLLDSMTALTLLSR